MALHLDLDLIDPKYDTCPCRRPFRILQADDGEDDDVKVWEVVYSCFVLLGMLVALLSDRVGADSVMLVAVTAFMASQIISVEEGLSGFANEGLLTVLALFVVAEGINKTGALDWYMGKLLGRPNSAAAAQLKLMIPISIVSAFLNNTPVVAVMIPIVQRWAKNIRISVQQLLIPLSFASILGGTCTLIGTSTNLVVVGLLQERYPNDPDIDIGLFDLGEFGVPIAFAGMTYILLASPFLLPGGSSRKDGDRGAVPIDSQEDILLGARLTPWSPAAGRSVKRSGLRDTGGIYLVSVHRAATGNVHRAVGQEFVLNVGDKLYFTGLVEGFGEFCEEHGMEVLTNETNEATQETPETTQDQEGSIVSKETAALPMMSANIALSVVVEEKDGTIDVPAEVGVTKESHLRADEDKKSRTISRMTDLIRGTARDEPADAEDLAQPGNKRQTSIHRDTNATQVVVAADHGFVVICTNAHDRPGLLLDISKGLLRLNLSLRHTEAAVVGTRSISIWRCELIDSELPDLEEIWSVLNALLENEHGSQAVKKRGLRVIRAAVTKNSSLIGRTAIEINFRETYKAAIVAVQKGGRNASLSSVRFGAGDVLVMQASDDSPLLKIPPADFYKRLSETAKDVKSMSRASSVASFVNKLTRNASAASFEKNQSNVEPTRDDQQEAAHGDASPDDGFFIGDGDSNNGDLENAGEVIDMASLSATVSDELAWKDLQVLFDEGTNKDAGVGSREFLAAMEVAPHSKLANRTVAETGLDKLPGVFLVSIDRPTGKNVGNNGRPKVTMVATVADAISSGGGSEAASLPTVEPIFTAIPPETPLMGGDVLWFAGSASAVGDLRKVPGLISFENEEVEKIDEKIHDRRLVEAVVARRGPLVGKTVKEVQFRTRFGAAVIAVHRNGNRIHDHPGKIKLQAGDVLLLEAGPTFIRRNADNDRSFALLAEVEDSAPPRLSLLIPALVITAAMLIVFTAGVASLLICALVASILMVLLGIMSEQEARDAVNWDIYITIAAAFGIGIALVNSGVAGGIASFLVDVGEAVGIGDAGLLGAVYFATFFISNVVTNNAAAALLFPIALDAAEQTGTDRILMSYALMLGASASFMSPFGYTTNLLIYGPGGYKTKDFLMIGTPMQIVLWILSILFLSTSTPWWVSWITTFMALMLVVILRVFKLSIFGIFGSRSKEADT